MSTCANVCVCAWTEMRGGARTTCEQSNRDAIWHPLHKTSAAFNGREKQAPGEQMRLKQDVAVHGNTDGHVADHVGTELTNMSKDVVQGSAKCNQ